MVEGNKVSPATELQELRVVVERFDKTVSRLCVLMERFLATTDPASERTRAKLSSLHPDMAKIQAEVASKMRKGKPKS